MQPAIFGVTLAGAGAGAGATCTGDSKGVIQIYNCTKYEVIAGTHHHCCVCYLESLKMHLQVQVQVQVAPALVTVNVSPLGLLCLNRNGIHQLVWEQQGVMSSE